MDLSRFLPVSREDMRNRDWYYYDFLLVTGDAYVDHPSFGAAVIGRVLEDSGFRVAVLAQPDRHSSADFEKMGRPRYAALITSGNLDSMVAHYTAAKKRRSEDFYSPGKKAGLRPDRAVIVYSNLVRAAFPGLPVIIGGLEASLRRFAHYDYWDGKVRRPILFDSRADIVVYGMGEEAIREIAVRLSRGESVTSLTDIRGTAYVADSVSEANRIPFPVIPCASFEEVSRDKRKYAEAAMLQYNEHDSIRGAAVSQKCGGRDMIVNPPSLPLTDDRLDRIFELPYTRDAHPMYDKYGGVPAIEEVRFSIIHNRGCFGGCSFCALAFHQGRVVSSRSHESVLREAAALTARHDFKGYINDVGGPTANFRRPACKLQAKRGVCTTTAERSSCLAPAPCKHLDTSHTDYMLLLRKIAALPGVKKVFVRSGIRFDYLLLDKSGEFFTQLVRHHISGQLKVAPEHCVDDVLSYMGKPCNEVFERFSAKYLALNARYGKRQFLVPYLISSHPGSSLQNAVSLAEYLRKSGRQPEQVQDFYPTPGTLSTCMYYTGFDPRSMMPVFVPRTAHEKAMQRALLQWKNPKNRRLCREALKAAGREDLIGYGKRCLVPPETKKRQTKL